MAQEVYHPTTPEVYQRTIRIIRTVVFALAHVTVRGLEHVPTSGALLGVCNHLSVFDAPVIFATVPRQAVVFVTSKHKRNPLFAALARAGGCIWVERGEADRAALKAAIEVLKTDLALAMAPEGTRSPTHALQRAKAGVAFIATRANVPILPVAVWGVEQIKQTWKRGRRAHVTVACGKVFRLPDDPRARVERLEAYTTEIMCHLAALLPEKYRGVYAEHPRVGELLERDVQPSNGLPSAIRNNVGVAD